MDSFCYDRYPASVVVAVRVSTTHPIRDNTSVVRSLSMLMFSFSRSRSIPTNDAYDMHMSALQRPFLFDKMAAWVMIDLSVYVSMYHEILFSRQSATYVPGNATLYGQKLLSLRKDAFPSFSTSLNAKQIGVGVFPAGR